MGKQNQKQNGGRTNSRNRSNKQQKTEFSALASEQRKRFLSSETSHIGEITEVLRGGFRGGVRLPPLKFAKHICYATLFKQFNKQLFHEWLTRDL
jgi:hypothetical protein